MKNGWYWVRFRFGANRALQIGLHHEGEWSLVGVSRSVEEESLDVVAGPITVPEGKREGH